MRSRGSGKRGQAVVLLLALLVAMAALALWVTDIDRYVMAKLRVQDGGDAAALAAARWQAAGVNLCGELNLIQAYMLADDVENAEAALALHGLRQRVCLTAPMLAFLSAQSAAEANQLPELQPAEEVRDFLRDSVRYALFEGYDDPEQAAADFRDMMEIVLDVPIRAFPLTPLYDTGSGSLLTNQDFYEAVLGRDWCWFWFNAYAFMQQYRGRGDFGPMPKPNTEPFFGLRLGARTLSLEATLAEGEGTLETTMNGQLSELGHPTLPPPPSPESGSPALYERTLEARWTVFDGEAWGPWEVMRRGELPIEGVLRDEYDYKGASAAVSVERDGSSWLAAAKAFGEVGGENPTDAGLVLGGFDAVRLIPVDAADPGIRGFDLDWLRHLRFHVQSYSATGALADGCRYCTALRLWENPAFRATGLEWLAAFGHTCRRPRPGGSSDGGGAHYGH